MPRLKKIDRHFIENAGYAYDSSLNPTFLPGRYNNFFKKRTIYKEGKLFVIPISATPLIRFPLCWLTFKNFPLPIIKLASQIILRKDSYLNIYFHSWEFADLKKFKLPSYVKKPYGEDLIIKLTKYIRWLKSKKHAKFMTFSEFCSAFIKKNKASKY